MKIITKDLFEASYLLSKGMTLQEVMGDKRTVLFQLTGDESLEILKTKYEQKTASVNVYLLRKHLNHLRDVVFERLKRRELINP